MGKLVYALLLVGVLLVGCSESESVELTGSEQENLELAQADLSEGDFDANIQAYNEQIAELNGTEYVDMLEGTSYEAYLYTRAKLSEESYKKAQDANIFDTSIDYDVYKGVSDALPSKSEYFEVIGEDEDVNYTQHVAKTVQYMTPAGSIE